MSMKYVASLFLLGLAGAAFGSDNNPSPANPDVAKPEVKVVEQIVAKVNGEIITLSDLEKAKQQLAADIAREQLPQARALDELKQREPDVLREKIDNLLLVQKAKELNINVDQDVSKYLAQMQLQSKIADIDRFHDFLREQTGMPFEDFKAQLRDNFMTRDVVRREIGSRITISKAEEQKYYDEHKNDFIRDEQVVLREIFLSTANKDAAGVAAVEKKAKDLVARARKGENFANMARENSDANTAENYGELPPFKKGSLKKDIEDIVFKAERGYVTDPLKQDNGLLILKVEEHYKAGLQPFEAVENEIMDRLMMPRMQPAMRTYLSKLRQDAFLEIREGYVDTGAVPGKDTTWRAAAKLKPQTVTKEEVATRKRRRRFLWMVPVPGTTTVKTAPAGKAPAEKAAQPTETQAANKPAEK